MANIRIETKNQLEIGKKPRVYFTCHPDDFDKYFKKICDDIFKTHDCAIYYTEDMTEAIAEDEKETDLGRNNLFVIPVTFKLLSTPNRTMDEDFCYAIEKHIPVLPIMMETGLDELYSKSDKFGELQYLNPYSTDPTEISYEKKLKKYLESTLISDEMAQRVRAAFDAYIFLSYRKKDRVYANQLMKLIHSNPECRDIAIWFDEFLTPGESFKEGIDKILHNSQLFTLLVTPNLLEEPNGEPNFVMGEEYPAAQKSGINILPAEMVETDKVALKEKYIDIPECVKPEGEEFYAQLLDSVTKIATQANNTPEHNFLIGLAYLDGVDVEVNHEFALQLITSAAEAGLPEAMEKLRSMYTDGVGVSVDYSKAIIWAEKLADCLSDKYGVGNINTLAALNNYAYVCGLLKDYKKALEINQRVYDGLCETMGEADQDTLTSLNNIAYNYAMLKDFDKALELNEKVYNASFSLFGEKHPDTLAALNNLAGTHMCMKNYEITVELLQKVYSFSCEILGENYHLTVTSLSNLAFSYYKLGAYEKALELYKKIFKACCERWGLEHPDTVRELDNLIGLYAKMEDFEKAEALNQKSFEIRKTFSDESTAVMHYMHNSIIVDSCKPSRKNAEIEDAKKEYVQAYEKFGLEHIETISALERVAFAFKSYMEYGKALNIFKKVSALQKKVLGETHEETLLIQERMADVYCEIGEYEKAIEIEESVYETEVEIYGKYDNKTIISLMALAGFYGKSGDLAKQQELKEKYEKINYYKERTREYLCAQQKNNAFCPDITAEKRFMYGTEKLKNEYDKRCSTLGKEHPGTLSVLCKLALMYTQWGDYTQAKNSIYQPKRSVSACFDDVAIWSKIDNHELKIAFELNLKARELMCKVFGKEHPDTLVLLDNLAYTYSLVGQHLKDMVLQEEVYNSRRNTLGECHPDTLLSMANLWYCYSKQGSSELANDYRDKLFNALLKLEE